MVANTKPMRRAAATAAITKNAPSKSKKSKKTSSKKAKSPAKVPAKTMSLKEKLEKKRRVVAKKTTVRAPNVRKIESSEKVEEEIEDDISIESDEKAVERVPNVKGIKVLRKKRSQMIVSDEESKSSDESKSESDESILSPSKLTKKTKSKKPKKVKKVKKVVPKPRSPVKKSPGRPVRVVRTFVGAQRLAIVAKRIFTDPTVSEENRPKAIVVEKAVFEPGKVRRVRSSWSAAEIDELEQGVAKHGEGAWSAILHDQDFSFVSGERSQVDLKDKWRNLNSYVPYSNHPIRKFILVDSKHQPMYTAASNLHIFNNRWPRDAAMKVATRDTTYPRNPDGTIQDSVLIHLKEELDDQGRLERPQIVHVYRATRVLQRPKNIKKFEGYAAIWTGKVEKVAEEILVKQDEILSV